MRSVPFLHTDHCVLFFTLPNFINRTNGISVAAFVKYCFTDSRNNYIVCCFLVELVKVILVALAQSGWVQLALAVRSVL